MDCGLLTMEEVVERELGSNSTKIMLVYGADSFVFGMAFSGFLRSKGKYVLFVDASPEKIFKDMIPGIEEDPENCVLVNGVMYAQGICENQFYLYDYVILMGGCQIQKNLNKLVQEVYFISSCQEISINPVKRLIAAYEGIFSIVLLDVPYMSETPDTIQNAFSIILRKRLKNIFTVPFSERNWNASIQAQRNIYFNINSVGQEYKYVMESVQKCLCEDDKEVDSRYNKIHTDIIQRR